MKNQPLHPFSANPHPNHHTKAEQRPPDDNPKIRFDLSNTSAQTLEGS
jgi:hypothetical protein